MLLHNTLLCYRIVIELGGFCYDTSGMMTVYYTCVVTQTAVIGVEPHFLVSCFIFEIDSLQAAIQTGKAC